MSRSISPPPAKRRRTETQAALSLQREPTATTASLPSTSLSTLRIFSWNVNGIAPFLQRPITTFFQVTDSQSAKTQDVKNVIPPASLRGFLQRHDWPAVLFLQEVKIAVKDENIQGAVRTAINSALPCESAPGAKGPLYEAHFTLPTDLHNARGLRGNGKIYGVCSIFRSDLRGKFNINTRTVDWDNEGRISVLEVEYASTKLAIFNIYAVNGTDNPYRNPITGAIQGTRHDRKLEFHRSLMQECIDLEDAGWLVVLAGDMNVAPDARDGHPKLRIFPPQHTLNRADFHEKLLTGNKGKIKGFNGVDIWRKMHDKERKYTYFPRGATWGCSCDRVDYFLAGRTVWDKGLIKACGILDNEMDRGPSDHVPIWADIKLEDNDRID